MDLFEQENTEELNGDNAWIIQEIELDSEEFKQYMINWRYEMFKKELKEIEKEIKSLSKRIEKIKKDMDKAIKPAKKGWPKGKSRSKKSLKRDV